MTRPFGLCAVVLLAPAVLAGQQASFTIDQAMSPPFPDELVAAPGRSGAVAWVFNARGARNVWVAAPPDYRGKAVTTYADDDGQELADLRWTPDARAIVYVRGGGPNPKGEYPNPHSLVTGVEQAVWVVAASGGAPRRVGEGHSPAVSRTGGRVAFLGGGGGRGGLPGGDRRHRPGPRAPRDRRPEPDPMGCRRAARVSLGEGRVDPPVFGSRRRRSGHAAHTGRVRRRARGREPGRRDGRLQLQSGRHRAAPHLEGGGRGRRGRGADPRHGSRVDAGGDGGRTRGRLHPRRDAHAAASDGVAGLGAAPRSRPRRDSRGVPGSRPRGPAAGAVPRRRRHDHPRAAVPAARRQAGGAPPRGGLFPRWLAAPDAAGLALRL